MGTSESGSRRGKLVSGVRIALYHPAFKRTCRACETYQFSDHGIELDESGNPRKRSPRVPTPCRTCPKVPEWAKQVEGDYKELRKLADDMTEANRQAYRYYLECKATQAFPSDPIVRWYSGLIRDVEDGHQRYQSERHHNDLSLLVMLAELRLTK